MLSAGDLYLFHITTHVSLRDAIDGIDGERLETVIRLAEAFTRALGWADEPIGLAGLNPHAGEGGVFGREEIEIFQPAVARARV